jgi:Photosynthetic reaction centre cytochrome C subunit
MTRYLRSSALLSALALSSYLAHAQAPAPPAGQAPRPPRPAPTNLKVLPKTMTGDQVLAQMRLFTGYLGVECNFCHAEDPVTKRPNAALDTNPMKDTARFMITMTADLNEKLDTMPGKMYADPVTCGTCHRGEKHPSVFVPAPRAPQAPRPPAAATPPPPR